MEIIDVINIVLVLLGCLLLYCVFEYVKTYREYKIAMRWLAYLIADFERIKSDIYNEENRSKSDLVEQKG